MARGGLSVSNRSELAALIEAEVVRPLEALTNRTTSPEARAIAAREVEMATWTERCDRPLLEATVAVSMKYESEYISQHIEELTLLRRAAYP